MLYKHHISIPLLAFSIDNNIFNEPIYYIYHKKGCYYHHHSHHHCRSYKQCPKDRFFLIFLKFFPIYILLCVCALFSQLSGGYRLLSSGNWGYYIQSPTGSTTSIQDTKKIIFHFHNSQKCPLRCLSSRNQTLSIFFVQIDSWSPSVLTVRQSFFR